MNQQKLLAVHKWLGLLSGIFILVLGLTGSIIVFDDEIERFIHRDVVHLHEKKTAAPVSVDRAYQHLREKYENRDVRFTYLPENSGRAIEAEVRSPDGRRYVYLHPVSGSILRDLDSYDTFSYWMLKLHYTLHAGFIGEVLIFVFGLFFIGSLITGFWFYRKAIGRVLRFKIRPRFRDFKSTSSELHRFVGVWALIANLIMGLTGVFIMVIILNTVIKAPENPPPPNPPPVTASIDALLEKSKNKYPGFTPSYISMPTRPEGKITLYGSMESDLPIHYTFSNYVQYDPAEGTETGATFIKNQPLSAHLTSIIYPLHFGDWGGIGIKILYCIFGISPALLSITGFIIWRNRQKGPRTKRVDPSQQKEFREIKNLRLIYPKNRNSHKPF